MSGLRKLKKSLRSKYGLVVSDTTGKYPGDHNGDNGLHRQRAAELCLPFRDPHPGHTEVFRSNSRQSQTFDQIAFVTKSRRLPTSEGQGHGRQHARPLRTR